MRWSDGYGIQRSAACSGLRRGSSTPTSDLTRWMPHADTARGRRPPRRTLASLSPGMHKAVTVLMLKLEAEVIARNPDFEMQGRDYLRQIDYDAGTVRWRGQGISAAGLRFPDR